MLERPNCNNTVFFSTSNDSYIVNSATSLLTIRNYIPKATLYIISKHISSKNKRFLAKHNIDFIEIDLTYLFFQTWQYPSECYYLFAGPQLFKTKGFTYSVYIDGDILCLQDPLKNIPAIKDIGGVEANTYAELFGAEQNLISEIAHSNTKVFQEKRLHSGVIYMNNQRLIELGFLEKSGKLFLECWQRGIPRKGDDSLFALFQIAARKQLSIKKLPPFYNYMPHYQGCKTNPSTVFVHFTFDKPWKIHPYRHNNTEQNSFNPYTKSWRKAYRQTSISKWFSSLFIPSIARKVTNKLYKYRLSLYYVLKGLRKPIIIKRRNLKKPAIKLYWWQPPHINNFGDLISKDIILNIFGQNAIYAPPESCDLASAGSILEIILQAKRNSKLYIWGSGFIKKRTGKDNFNNIIFKAVRGEKTKQRTECHNIPTGDPGILAGPTYLVKKKKHSHKIGIIIHYADMQTPIAKQFCEDNRFNVISPLDTPQNIAQKVSECGLILSSSLHGLIFADSLSIPNAHIKISNNLTGGEYKFIDYYTGINKQYTKADVDRIFDDNYLNKLIQNYRPIHKLEQKQRSLIKSFPF